MSDDLTLHILREIRDEIRGTNQRVDQLSTELRGTNQRVDKLGTDLCGELAQTRTELRAEVAAVREDLGRRITEVELRLATSYTELIASTRDVHELLINNFGLRDRVEACEHDIGELKRQIPQLR
jgi:chromosome segregation ATPase